MSRLTEKVICNLPDEVIEELGISDVPEVSYDIKGMKGKTCAEICKDHLCNDCPIQRIIVKLGKYEDEEDEEA